MRFQNFMWRNIKKVLVLYYSVNIYKTLGCWLIQFLNYCCMLGIWLNLTISISGRKVQGEDYIALPNGLHIIYIYIYIYNLNYNIAHGCT